MRECSRDPSSIEPFRSWCILPALEKRRSTPADVAGQRPATGLGDDETSQKKVSARALRGGVAERGRGAWISANAHLGRRARRARRVEVGHLFHGSRRLGDDGTCRRCDLRARRRARSRQSSGRGTGQGHSAAHAHGGIRVWRRGGAELGGWGILRVLWLGWKCTEGVQHVIVKIVS